MRKQLEAARTSPSCSMGCYSFSVEGVTHISTQSSSPTARGWLTASHQGGAGASARIQLFLGASPPRPHLNNGSEFWWQRTQSLTLQILFLGNFSRNQTDQATLVYCYPCFGLILFCPVLGRSNIYGFCQMLALTARNHGLQFTHLVFLGLSQHICQREHQRVIIRY